MEAVKVLENVKILYGEDLRLLEGYLLIEEGVIVEVGGGSFKGKAESRIDGRRLLALPGLINAHTHLGDSVAKELGLGLSLERVVAPPDGLKHRFLQAAKPETLVYWMERTLRDMASSGTTCFADFREGGLEGVLLLKQALERVGLRGVVLARPTSPERLEAELESLVRAADGLGIGTLNQYSDDALSLASRLKGKKLLAAHASEGPHTTREVERAVKKLKADLLVHLSYAQEWEFRLAAEADVGVVVCPRSNTSFALNLPDIRKMEELNLKLALGTDNVMTCQPDLFREMEFTSRVLRLKYGDPSYPPPQQVFRMATLGAAEVLKLEKHLGSLEEGKLADIILLNLEASNIAPVHHLIAALVHRARAENVMLTMVGGEVVHSRINL